MYSKLIVITTTHCHFVVHSHTFAYQNKNHTKKIRIKPPLNCLSLYDQHRHTSTKIIHRIKNKQNKHTHPHSHQTATANRKKKRKKITRAWKITNININEWFQKCKREYINPHENFDHMRERNVDQKLWTFRPLFNCMNAKCSRVTTNKFHTCKPIIWSGQQNPSELRQIEFYHLELWQRERE